MRVCLNKYEVYCKQSNLNTKDPFRNTKDPFSQKPLICLTDEHPWSVYSVGTNLVDDSGSLKPIEGGSQPLDLGFVKISGLKPKSDD